MKKNKTTVADFIFTLVDHVRRGDIFLRASSLSFDLLMAGIPLILLLILLGSLFFASPSSPFLGFLHVLPDTIAEVIRSILQVLTENLNPGTIGIGIAVSVWQGSNGMDKLMLGVNTSLGFELRGNVLLRRGLAILYTVLFTFAMILLLFMFVFSRGAIQVWEQAVARLGIAGLDGIVEFLNSIVAKLIPFVFFFFVLVLFYRTAPIVSHGSVSWREAAFGGVVSGLGILLLTFGYGYILDNVSRLSLYFGSLAGILGLFAWLKYTCLIIIFAAEVVATVREMRHGGLRGRLE